MFTGIVTARGRVAESRRGYLGVAHAAVAGRLRAGSSVAVNGVCLTVTARRGDTFFADVVPETLRRTNLGILRAGDEVNLELPLRPTDGLDGHLVQGHVDGTTEVVGVRNVELGREVTFALPAQLARYLAAKGSIAIDGTSLTIAEVDDRRGVFSVALVPTTLERTIAAGYGPGRLVNVEVDVVARYIERLMQRGTDG